MINTGIIFLRNCNELIEFCEAGGESLLWHQYKQLKTLSLENIFIFVTDETKESKYLKRLKREDESVRVINSQNLSELLESEDILFSELTLTAYSDYFYETELIEKIVENAGKENKNHYLQRSEGDSNELLGMFIINKDSLSLLVKNPDTELVTEGFVSVEPYGYFVQHISQPEDIIKVEMFLRKKKRQSLLKEQPTSGIATKTHTFDFVAGEPVTTKMVVGRGFVNNPQSIQFIPPESASSPIFLFTDETVHHLYGKDFHQKLLNMGYNVHLKVMADGESSKSLENYVKLTNEVLKDEVDERSVFISLGGGVVCNVCGFIASTIYRGLNLVHFPTSLMAQCDAAISHKQAINGMKGKNMVGSYFSPSTVAVDIETLLTMEKRQISDGMSEVIKHALGQDQSYVDFLMAYEGDYTKDLEFLTEVVKRNVELKCALSSFDPKEHREGMVLQYGHTVGHPVEYLSGYSLYHGESVAIGMVVAAHISNIMGVCDKDLVDLHVELLKKYNLPVTIPDNMKTSDIIDALKFNKRFLIEGSRMGLLTGVAELLNVNDDYVIPVSVNVLREAIERTRK